ncbi:MAG: cellulase family glycosylhydrolase [Candidatus Omnitrophica bacterium]|nr:cellulase family glycosylhydrolase [Candidatus Omnitrophota bacterium]
MCDRLFLAVLSILLLLPAHASDLERIRVDSNQQAFVTETSGKPFVPWGFNYDHDDDGELIEDYWESDWPRVEEDFREMKELGANVVRVHLQFNRFIESPTKTNAHSFGKLRDLLDLTERVGLYLDLTGLGCYHKQDTPEWYDAMSEEERWAAQGFFWREVAKVGSTSHAVFCYDLMNEPIVPGKRREDGGWLGPEFAGKYFVQFITLDPSERERVEVARSWISTLKTEIRKEDPKTLVTVGLVPWSLRGRGMSSGFYPDRIVDLLDFLCIHAYPKTEKPGEVLGQLKAFRVGAPVVIEETFPLHCSIEEFESFMESTRGVAAGWIGFYWGEKPEVYREREGFAADATLQWLEFFEKNGPLFKSPFQGGP